MKPAQFKDRFDLQYSKQDTLNRSENNKKFMRMISQN